MKVYKIYNCVLLYNKTFILKYKYIVIHTLYIIIIYYKINIIKNNK